MTAVNLNNYSAIQISGKDATTFLQGQLTCDVLALDKHKANFGAHCNRQGRALSVFVIFLQAEKYYLWMPSEVVESSLADLQKYAVFSKVELSIITLACYGLITENSSHYSNNEATLLLEFPGENRHLLFNFQQELTPETEENHLWHQLDIENLIPRLYPQTIGQFLPHHLNLLALGGISFTKGCYTGQEIIARMQHRGKIKKQLSTLSFLREVTPGEKIIDAEKALGECVDNLSLPKDNYLLLAITKIS
jgi:folate-binding protein YgfZ